MTDQEINAAVAKKLGWKQLGPMKHDPLNVYLEKNGQRIEGIPDYCHSIEAAWEIVERYQYWVGPDKEKWAVTTVLGIWLAEADTAPMAICLASLKPV